MIEIEGTVRGPLGQETLKFLVDSGAQYTLVPNDVWQRIGLEAKWTMTFSLADASHIDRQISECHITLSEGDGHTTVILGEPGDEALLGIITLEQFGFVLDPFTRQLRRAHLRLMSVTP